MRLEEASALNCSEGTQRADGRDGRISSESPLARTLLEQREGEEVEVVRPRGVAMATLVSVR